VDQVHWYDGTGVVLIDRLRKKETQTLAVAYDSYGPVVYALFLRITRDPGMAEDLVQELFIRLWNRCRILNPGTDAFEAWIFSTARTMAIDHIRSAQARTGVRFHPTEDLDRFASPGSRSDPESALDRARTLTTAFSRLSFNQKRVLELSLFEGFSQSEIAARLHEPLGKVKNWTRSALDRLQDWRAEHALPRSKFG